MTRSITTPFVAINSLQIAPPERCRIAPTAQSSNTIFDTCVPGTWYTSICFVLFFGAGAVVMVLVVVRAGVCGASCSCRRCCYQCRCHCRWCRRWRPLSLPSFVVAVVVVVAILLPGMYVRMHRLLYCCSWWHSNLLG